MQANSSLRIQLSNQPLLIFLFISLMIATGIRLAFILPLNFPVNDGGMFYVMAQELIKNHFLLPVTTAYNFQALPYAYSPLGMYIAALLSTVTGWSLLDIFRFLPLIANLLTFPAVYALSKTILRTNRAAALATVAYAFFPKSIEWVIAGGGVTRSVAFLLAMLALRQGYLLFATTRSIYIFSVAILSALTILSHPQIGLLTAVSIAFFFLWFDHTLRGLLWGILVAVGVTLITLPWWWVVISQHGLTPLLAALGASGSYNLLQNVLKLFLGFDISRQPILGLVALLSFFQCLLTRKFFLPLWVILIYLVSAHNLAVVPISLLVAYQIDSLVLPAIRKSRLARSKNTIVRIAAISFLGLLAVVTAIAAYKTSMPVVNDNSRAAMAWVSQNTPADRQFLMITGHPPFEEAVTEWFPVLAQHRSVMTIQGMEWLPDGLYQVRRGQQLAVQGCIVQGIDCLDKWSQSTHITFTDVYIALSETGAATPLQESLEKSSVYEMIFQNDAAVVFHRK